MVQLWFELLSLVTDPLFLGEICLDALLYNDIFRFFSNSFYLGLIPCYPLHIIPEMTCFYCTILELNVPCYIFFFFFFFHLEEYDSDDSALEETSKPMVDGGTEGFQGHARVIVPGVTPCFECTIWLFPPQVKFPLCTLAETPRTAAHCIEYAHLIKWDEVIHCSQFQCLFPLYFSRHLKTVP